MNKFRTFMLKHRQAIANSTAVAGVLVSTVSASAEVTMDPQITTALTSGIATVTAYVVGAIVIAIPAGFGINAMLKGVKLVPGLVRSFMKG